MEATTTTTPLGHSPEVESYPYAMVMGIMVLAVLYLLWLNRDLSDPR